MIVFERFTLKNGLRVIYHQDPAATLSTVCLTYDVGTKDEKKGKTGLAHLFEHLLFSGSKNCKNFDVVIQEAGGENNAYTNQDMTVYYNTIPHNNLDVALWLEADRMSQLQIKKSGLQKEKKIVIEEFKETTLDEPYGDVWHYIGPKAYHLHPYQIPTIGACIEDIQSIDMEDIKNFYSTFYQPSNAVLSVCTQLEFHHFKEKVSFWFESIPSDPAPKRVEYPINPITQNQVFKLLGKVVQPCLFLIFQSTKRLDPLYYLDDIISDFLAEGENAYLYKNLVKDQAIFAEIDAYVTGNTDGGLFIIEAKPLNNISLELAHEALWKTLEQSKSDQIGNYDFEKICNQIAYNQALEEQSSFNKAIQLGYYELLGDAALIDKEMDLYFKANLEDLNIRMRQLLDPNKNLCFFYLPK